MRGLLIEVIVVTELVTLLLKQLAATYNLLSSLLGCYLAATSSTLERLSN